jgi:dihydroorotase
VTVDAGRVAAVGPAGRGRGASQILYAKGLVLLPGFVDMHVHLREPGQEHKENIASGTRAAAAGGVTTVAAMPNTSPALDEPGIVGRVARARSMVRVVPVAALTRGRAGRVLVDLDACRAAGAAAFSDDGTWLESEALMREALAWSATTSALVISHCEVPGHGGVLHDGPVAERLGVKGIPASVEVEAVRRDLALAKATGGRLHLAHLSCAASVDLLRAAKGEGVHVTAEVTPHHLLLTEDAALTFGTDAKVNPPLRTEADRRALVGALADGTVDAIASDHAPHAAAEKARGLAEAPFGISSLDVLLPLVWEGLVGEARLLEAASATPARLLGLEPVRLEPGARADLVLVAPKTRWTVDPGAVRSKGRNSPWGGRVVTGKVMLTLVAGVIAHAEPTVVPRPARAVS